MSRRSLTAAAVERIKPPPKGQVDHFDKGFPGLALRTSHGGRKSWVFFYRIGGRLRRMTLGAYPALELAAARDAWREARLDVAAGRDPARARKGDEPATTFSSVADEWLHRDQKQNRSFTEVKRIIEHDVLPSWQHRQVSDISRRDVLDLLDGIADRGAVVMARRVYAHLHRFFRWCVGRGIIGASPMVDLPKPGKEMKRDRVLNDTELRSVWYGAEQLGWPFGDAIRLLILTGSRREEISALHWSEIEGDTIRLAGNRTKTAEPHSIPLSSASKLLLAHLPRVAGSDLIFTTNGRTPISGWSRAKSRLSEAVDLPPWRLHDLRRTVATGLQRLGVSLQIIEAILGHTSGSRSGIVGVYQRHSFDAEKQAALEAWGQYVMALVERSRSRKAPSAGGEL